MLLEEYFVEDLEFNFGFVFCLLMFWFWEKFVWEDVVCVWYDVLLGCVLLVIKFEKLEGLFILVDIV